jgi:multicomponent Na+:H+ antiporter subunit F
MHQALLTLATIWMTGLLAAIVIFSTRARTNAVRILVLDALTLILVALLVLFSTANGQSYYFDAALALALVSFIGTVAAARRLASGRVL